MDTMKIEFEETTTELINEMIRDYRWMKTEVKRLQNVLFGETAPMRNWEVAKGTTESDLPNGPSLNRNSRIEQMDIREEKQYERLIRLERRVYALEYAFQALDSELHKTVYDLLLDGMTYRSIAAHLGLSKDYVQSIKKDIVVQIRENNQIPEMSGD